MYACYTDTEFNAYIDPDYRPEYQYVYVKTPKINAE